MSTRRRCNLCSSIRSLQPPSLAPFVLPHLLLGLPTALHAWHFAFFPLCHPSLQADCLLVDSQWSSTNFAQERPCTRCIKRNIGHLCHDEPRESESKKSKSTVGDTSVADESEDFTDPRASLSTATGNPSASTSANAAMRPPSFDTGREAAKNAFAAASVLGQANPMQLVRPSAVSGIQPNLMSSNDVSQFGGFSDAWLTAQNHFHDMHDHSGYMIVPEVSGELQFLNDFLQSSMVDDAAYVSDDQSNQMLRSAPPDVATNFLTSGTGSSATATASGSGSGSGNDGKANVQNDNSAALAGNVLLPASALGTGAGAGSMLPPDRATSVAAAAASGALDISSLTDAPSTRSAAVDKAREYYFQAADPSGNDTPEQRMSDLLKAKYDAGLLKPFNYVKGYARLHTYLDSHKIAPASKQKILRQLDRFRPKFREKMQALTDLELIYVEMWFEKTLMEYDRVFASMAVPACCWRRTGEIFRGNKEMAELIHVPVESLRDGKIALHEILTEESMVRYWEEFGTIAFDSAHDTLLTACSIKNPSDSSKDPIIKCCFSLKIRRDDHKIQCYQIY
ncbi:zn cluster transcription factor [Sporothrix schenckii 1099-18]|uniref:Zn cluster transcription factor n=1 Tax=Sporothrix schenckii 1099-18 TaxID=1397361 RepID=A0A0F2M4E6_SPOSC|nr:zn cluster transcription factor [Sporothrix schenckii 1099-18]KJR83954.1 zn cluster transcription factor [Sporothrix schenckii 1099-18]